jgi:acid phosphatase
MLVTAVVLLVFSVGSCVAKPEQAASTSSEQHRESGDLGHEMLNAVLWQATSADYKAIALQTYALAGRNLDTAIADPAWTAVLEQTEGFETLPPAIILDIDETVLDNSPYNVQVVSQLSEYSRKSFKDWCLKAEAPAVPGVQAFLADAVRKRVSVFYVSARTEDLRTCTIENLRRLGLPVADEQGSLFLAVGESKGDERRRVAERHRILLLIGDNLDDFADGSRATPEQRSVLARRYAKQWGHTWIILPNPMYGHWEDAFHGFDYNLPRAGKLESKHQGLTVGLKN